MENKEKARKRQKWMEENWEDWRTICGMGKYPISREEFVRLWDSLLANGFDEAANVLMTIHFYAVQDRIMQNLLAIHQLVGQERERRRSPGDGKANGQG